MRRRSTKNLSNFRAATSTKAAAPETIEISSQNSPEKKVKSKPTSEPPSRAPESSNSSDTEYFTATDCFSQQCPLFEQAGEIGWRYKHSPNTQRLRREAYSKWKEAKERPISLPTALEREPAPISSAGPSGLDLFKEKLQALMEEKQNRNPGAGQKTSKSFDLGGEVAESDDENVAEISFRKSKSDNSFDVLLNEVDVTLNEAPVKPEVPVEAPQAAEESDSDDIFLELPDTVPLTKVSPRKEEPPKPPVARSEAPAKQPLNVVPLPNTHLNANPKPPAKPAFQPKVPYQRPGNSSLPKPNSGLQQPYLAPMKPNLALPRLNSTISNAKAAISKPNPVIGKPISAPQRPPISALQKPNPALQKPNPGLPKPSSALPKPNLAHLEPPKAPDDDSDDFNQVLSAWEMSNANKRSFERTHSMPVTPPGGRSEPEKKKFAKQVSMPVESAPTQKRICTPSEIEMKRQRALALLRQKQLLRSSQNANKH